MNISKRPWRQDGVELVHGSPLWFRYGHSKANGVISNGRLQVNGIGDFDKPTSAIRAVVKRRTGEFLSLNGWRYVSTRLPDGKWVQLDWLRHTRRKGEHNEKSLNPMKLLGDESNILINRKIYDDEPETMMKTRTIAVDFDIHKMIEAERASFEETENAVLRRLLGLPELVVSPHPTSEVETDGGASSYRPSARSWRGKGVELPEGTALRLAHPRVESSGTIHNGVWIVEGKKFRTPSSAACYVVSEAMGRPMSVNGWLYWQVKRPTDSDWKPLNSLRPAEKVDRRYR